ncbi:unnamed protein product [Nesidiocoris tenuis]|uniref:RNA-directed DNA polymerase n=1 Tax=Nesidiocoris tenuis TaxID=355587 RepID=A0A6H5G507_9HEMI|nr:unnamed protein product [Nesidiocoris tenuis]
MKNDLLSGKLRDPEYSLSHNVIFKNERVVIPTSLRKDVLSELHRTHVGVVKMKQLARRHCFWKTIDKDIETLVKSCRECALTQKSPAKVPTHHWDDPQENFDRVHIDFAGPFLNHHYLVLVDSKSKWAEVRILRDSPTSASTIELLLDIFSFHGFPLVLVSDNATIFHSDSFKNFCTNHGIIQKFSAPGHPSTNGLAERYIQTLKSKLNAMENSPGTLQNKVREIIFRYRATPLQCGKTPAELYLHRNIRCQLDAFKPPKLQNKRVTFDLPPSRIFKIGDRVQVRWYTSNKDTWKFGRITQKFGNLHYQVLLDNGYTLKRHVDQLRRTLVGQDENQNQPADRTPDQPQFETSSRPQSNVDLAPYIASSMGVPAPVFQPRQPQTPERDPENDGSPNRPENPPEGLLRRSARSTRPPAHLNDFHLYKIV